MLSILKKRKNTRDQNEAFNFIKQILSDKFIKIQIKDVSKIPELSDMILYSNCCVIKARLDESNSVHIKIESINGFLYEGFTQNYAWFLETFEI